MLIAFNTVQLHATVQNTHLPFFLTNSEQWPPNGLVFNSNDELTTRFRKPHCSSNSM